MKGLNESGRKNAGEELTVKLLRRMGFDLASIHMGTGDRHMLISRDLKRRPKGWLQVAAKQATRMVEQDYAEWVAHKRHSKSLSHQSERTSVLETIEARTLRWRSLGGRQKIRSG
jgi:hypothetical protein